MLVGSCVAVVAATTAMLVTRGDGGASSRLPDERMIRAAIEATDPGAIHSAWQSMAQSGVDRGAMPEELQAQRQAGSLARIGALLWGLAAAGGLAAGGGGLAWLSARFAPRRGGQR